MDPTLVRKYHDRWQPVAEVVTAEQQRATVEDRWIRLNAILKRGACLSGGQSS